MIYCHVSQIILSGRLNCTNLPFKHRLNWVRMRDCMFSICSFYFLPFVFFVPRNLHMYMHRAYVAVIFQKVCFCRIQAARVDEHRCQQKRCTIGLQKVGTWSECVWVTILYQKLERQRIKGNEIWKMKNVKCKMNKRKGMKKERKLNEKRTMS